MENKKKICVIDGQGGGIGATIIKRLKERFEERIEVIALGTNAIATAQMLKARANKGASGTNAIVHTVKKADAIIGALSIIMPNAMMGEVTPCMAEAICSSDARKILLPLTQENVEIIGVGGFPLPQLVDELLNKHLYFIE
jgi:NAD(P)-dependent dehydrogenase (short-subunit alcohol dehydrogenase family)